MEGSVFASVKMSHPPVEDLMLYWGTIPRVTGRVQTGRPCMPKSKDRELNEVEIIAWAVPRIAGGNYVVSDDERGRELWVTEFETTLEEMEGALSHGPNERVRDALLQLKADCNVTNIRTFFNQLVGEKLGALLTEQFTHIDLNLGGYELAIAVGYRQLHLLTRGLQGILARGREGVAVPWLANLETDADLKAVSVAITTHYAQEISNLFPKMIRRAEQLRIVTTQEKAPPIVQRYIEEASKCYVYGRFIACIIVCRSAIEFALRDRLQAWGQQQALIEMKNQRSDSLWNLIELARLRFPGSALPTLDDADEIRKAARDAVHLAQPKLEVCKDVFTRTRGVLGELYSLESSK